MVETWQHIGCHTGVFCRLWADMICHTTIYNQLRKGLAQAMLSIPINRLSYQYQSIAWVINTNQSPETSTQITACNHVIWKHCHMPVLGRWNADEDDDKPGQRASGGWRYDDSDSPSNSSSDSNANSESECLGLKFWVRGWFSQDYFKH